MLNPPEHLTDDELTAALARHWGVVAESVRYRAVGWGSHHWEVHDPAGRGWFVTVDELHTPGAFERLAAALDAVRSLTAGFVVAPVPTAGDESVVRLGAGLAVAVHPLLTGTSYEWGAWSGPDHRAAVLDMLAELHSAPIPPSSPPSPSLPLSPPLTPSPPLPLLFDDFVICQREALDETPFADSGPFAAPAADLLRRHARPLRDALARYDAMAATADPARAVFTHGEPHPGNTMRTPSGWKLIDWETALAAPPERDLWHLGDHDLSSYAVRTGITPEPQMLDLYRLRWLLTDIAVDTARFRRPHTGTPDDKETFTLLQNNIALL